MERHNFTFTVNKGGYMIQYKGKTIGGVGTMSKGSNLRGKAIQKQIADYRNCAENTINHFLSGNISDYLQKQIDKIDQEGN